MQTGNLPVCNMDVFGERTKDFWMGDIKGLLENSPLLELPHKQNFYALYIIDKADGEIIIDSQKIRLDNAKIIIIKPGCISSTNINRDAVGKLICFTEEFFSLRYNNNMLNHFSFFDRNARVYVRLNEEQKGRWNQLLQFLSDEFRLRKKETKNVLRSYLNIFLFEMERLYNPMGISKSYNPKQEKMFQFQKLIEQHFKQKKMPSDYAELLHVTPNYLNKLCKKEIGHTAGDLIRKQIIIEAQRLLLYTTDSINEIADELGFDHTSYFVTFFKKQTELTPELFRKNQNE